MSPWQKFAICVAGIVLGCFGIYYTIHQNDPFSPRFWVGLAFAPCSALGSYLLGLFQDNPFKNGAPNPVPKL